MNEDLQTNTLATLRNQLMHTISSIRNGNMTSQDGVAVAKIGNVVVETYKTEIEAVRVADSLKDRNVGYRNALTAIPENNVE